MNKLLPKMLLQNIFSLYFLGQQSHNDYSNSHQCCEINNYILTVHATTPVNIINAVPAKQIAPIVI